jgi:hypothetical protein
MVGHGRTRVEHGGDADAGAQMFWIGGDGQHRLGRCLEQQIVEQRFVMEGDVGDFSGQRGDHVEVPQSLNDMVSEGQLASFCADRDIGETAAAALTRPDGEVLRGEVFCNASAVAAGRTMLGLPELPEQASDRAREAIAEAGRPEGVGRPSDAGRPAEPGSSSMADQSGSDNRPADAGRPDTSSSGSPSESGRAASAGEAGPPDSAGAPEGVGRS